ncbi:TPA: faeA-like family protein [Escherichia albertii]|uniref:FaeA/PapI family transcriptional regulator n=1 Tax=Escherichia albertii TaxID=208962 RepID=UPI00074426C7|nr:FaeA/PapI family transcriptional regulator [Escherichia albertii]HCQ4576755.1 faeA-like family protein [Escherichia albertii]
MKKDNYAEIIEFMTKQTKNGQLLFRTRDISDAMGLTIYQARQFLMNLNVSGVIRRTAGGKGGKVLWSLE